MWAAGDDGAENFVLREICSAACGAWARTWQSVSACVCGTWWCVRLSGAFTFKGNIYDGIRMQCASQRKCYSLCHVPRDEKPPENTRGGAAHVEKSNIAYYILCRARVWCVQMCASIASFGVNGLCVFMLNYTHTRLVHSTVSVNNQR